MSDGFKLTTDTFKSALGFGGSSLGGTPTFATPGKSYLLPAIGGIIVVALLVMIIYIIIQAREGHPQMETKGPIDLFQPESPIVVDRTNIRKSMLNTYTFSFYIRLDAVPDMRANAVSVFTWPGIWNMNYNPAQEELVWQFTQTKDSPDDTVFSEQTLHLKGVPLQKWTQITVTSEGRSLDFYIDGKLQDSTILKNLPPAGTSSITIVPNGVKGQTAYIQVWPRRLTVTEIANNYVDTSDSQGRPFLGPELLNTIKDLSLPNVFCPSGNCTPATPEASHSQSWEFPYA
jgi:hypothetical protein